ncbi:hypothetical protein DdX_12864 [Ditylenchus destructor]|uniref:Uncharacterized protein n=1 Tax=Ditylenchus destructor TaxID=166010 RepID=A0AAD4MUF2_9BILA|nr:hypothetical protein DdX_12864 [Ditylenchus destructor]
MERQRNGKKISRQHSHVLMAGEMTISALTILFIPLLVSLIAPHNTVEEWSRLFISIPFVQLTTLALFLIFCDSKPRPWTQRNQKEGEFESDRSDEYRLRSVSYGR